MINSQQIRGARAMLGLTQAELAKRAGISTTGLNNIESGQADPKASTLDAIQRALEAAGIEFTNGGESGVKLRALKPGEIVRYGPTGKTGAVIDRVPNMGGMVWVDFSDGPMSMERGRLMIVPPA